MSSSSTSVARFEFRLFAPDLDLVVTRMERAMRATGESDSRSLYLLRAGPDDINAKLRSDALDIKDRIAVRQGFEQWRPRDAQAFPLEADAVRGFEDLRIGRAAGAREFAEACRAVGIVLAHVVKQRRHFARDDLLGEHVRLVVNGARLDSIAIEGSDLEALAAMRAGLMLDGEENLNYAAALKRITGLAPLPAESAWRATDAG